MPPAARVLSKFFCPLVTPVAIVPVPHLIGGFILEGCPTVLIGDLPAATVMSAGLCLGPPFPHPSSVALGSFTVLIDSKPAARMGDITNTGGIILDGAVTVEIGE